MSEIKLTIIGCGDAFSSGGRGHTCFFVRAKKINLLIDCGATALSGLKAQDLSSEDVDAVVITHFHGDHFGGMPFLLLDAARLGRTKPLYIITPPGGQDRIDVLFDLFYPGSAKVLKDIDIRYQSFSGHDRVDCSELTIESFPVIHSKETLPHGLRITVDNATIAYTGDTEWTDTVSDIVSEADLAICECTFYKKNVHNHMNYKHLENLLPGFTCKRIILTHFDEEMLSNLGQVPYECAVEGKTITL